MVPEIAIWCAAELLIRKHGANAELEAAKRADVMIERSDEDGRVVWARIQAVEALTGATRWQAELSRRRTRRGRDISVVSAVG